MEIHSKVLYQKDYTEHEIVVHSLPIHQFQRKDDYAETTLQTQYDYQQFEMTIRLHPELLRKRKSLRSERFTLTFTDDFLHLHVTKDDIDLLLEKIYLNYEAHYIVPLGRAGQLEIHLTFPVRFYNAHMRDRLTKIQRERAKHQGISKRMRKSNQEEIRKRDLYETGRRMYPYSPNSDSRRSTLEMLGGNFSGESQYRK